MFKGLTKLHLSTPMSLLIGAALIAAAIVYSSSPAATEIRVTDRGLIRVIDGSRGEVYYCDPFTGRVNEANPLTCSRASTRELVWFTDIVR